MVFAAVVNAISEGPAIPVGFKFPNASFGVSVTVTGVPPSAEAPEASVEAETDTVLSARLYPAGVTEIEPEELPVSEVPEVLVIEMESVPTRFRLK